MKTYLITGGAGFIGSNFIIYLLNKYNDIRVIVLDKLTYAGNLKNIDEVLSNENLVFIKGDICDTVLVDRLFKMYNFDYVINFAAESHVDRSINSADEFVKTNVEGTVNLLNIAKKYWENNLSSHRYMQISTDEVYGSLNLGDKTFTETTTIKPRSPYSASKASADMFVKAFYNTHKLNICITRCSNNFGIKQHEEKLIPTVIKRILNNEKIPVYGDGKQIRDWLFVEDHCSAIDLVLHHGICGEVYNVGGNNEITNLDLIHCIGDYMVKNNLVNDYHIEHVSDRKGHDRRYGINSSKLQNELGWMPSVNFETNLYNTIDWYIKLYKKER